MLSPVTDADFDLVGFESGHFENELEGLVSLDRNGVSVSATGTAMGVLPSCNCLFVCLLAFVLVNLRNVDMLIMSGLVHGSVFFVHV